MVSGFLRRPVARISLGAGALIIVAAVAVSAFNSLQTGSSTRPLWPAKVPPTVGLCSAQLSYDPDGNVSPLFCPGAEINVLAWSYLAQEQLRVMALGPHPTPAAVETAVMQDLQAHASAATECSAAIIAAAYYGWNFHIQPTNGLRTDCPIQGQF